jgi:ComF family protein
MGGRLTGAAAGWAEGIGRLLLPPHCVGCGRPLGRRALFCAACRGGLTLIGERSCPRCGRPVGPYVPVGTDCAACRTLPLAHLAGAVAAGTYEGALRDLVLRFKRRRPIDLTRALVDLLLQPLERRPWLTEVAAVVPVPIHWRRRYFERGFNQAAVLGAALAARLGRPLIPALRRRRATPSQVGLSRTARVANVAGSVRAQPSARRLARRSVLLVDDVMTTGATLSECARVLRQAGVRRVYAAVIAVRHSVPRPAEVGPVEDV